MAGDGARAVIFDLGGVLVEVPGAAAMRELAGLETEDEVWRRWLACPWVSRFERGECTPEDFAAGVVDDWQLALTPAAFLDAFGGWNNRPFAGADDLVAEVAQTAPVAALSNMNQVHWEHMAGWDLLRGFSEVFLSYRLGLVKPDPAVFERVAAELDAAPAELVFLDDNQVNVDAAVACGYRARRVRGVGEARAALIAEGVVLSSEEP
jgi:putative hydrolase of the HAD superfamily